MNSAIRPWTLLAFCGVLLLPAKARAQTAGAEIAKAYGVELVLPFAQNSEHSLGVGVVLNAPTEGSIGHLRYVQSAGKIDCSRPAKTEGSPAANLDLPIDAGIERPDLERVLLLFFGVRASGLGGIKSARWLVRRLDVKALPDNVLGAHLAALAKSCAPVRQAASVVVQTAVTGDIDLVLAFAGMPEMLRADVKPAGSQLDCEINRGSEKPEITISVKKTVIGIRWLPVANYGP